MDAITSRTLGARMVDLLEAGKRYADFRGLYGRGPETLLERVARFARSGAETADDFRTKSAGVYSASTIESTISAVGRVKKWLGEEFEIGQRLRVPRPCPAPPGADAIGAIYSQASVTNWPTRLDAKHRTRWWQSFLAISYWTAFRLGDLEILQWRQITTEIELPAAKTTKLHRIPIVTTVTRHLDQLPRLSETVFGLTKCRKQLRRELKRMCVAAKVENVTMQQIRQCGINAWSNTNAKAGEIIHGSGIRGSMAHYLSLSGVLAAHAGRVPWPAEMLTPEERDAIESDEAELLFRFRRAPSEQRKLLLNTARLTG